MRVTFVRHTEVDVPTGTCYGRSDVGLHPSFPIEAAAVSNKLQAIADKEGYFDGVYSSPLSRCRRLAEACGYADAISDDSLLELDFGEWELQRFDDITDPHLEDWYADWFHVAPTGGESMEMQVARVKCFLDREAASGKENILVFTHAGVILSALLLTGRCSLSDLFDHRPSYGGILPLTYPR